MALHKGIFSKECRPWSEGSYKSPPIWAYTFCNGTDKSASWIKWFIFSMCVLGLTRRWVGWRSLYGWGTTWRLTSTRWRRPRWTCTPTTVPWQSSSRRPSVSRRSSVPTTSAMHRYRYTHMHRGGDNRTWLYSCYFFTKSYVWPLVRIVSMRRL